MTQNSEIPAIGSVLVVDDSPTQRRYSMALLLSLGIQNIQQAANGQEALELLKGAAEKPDLLIVDLEMPTMDGPELLSHLGQMGVQSPIIVASSREVTLLNSVHDMCAGLGLHILGAMQKPLNAEVLTGLLTSARAVAARAKTPRTSTGLTHIGRFLDPDMLRAGIDNGEILVHYHPLVELTTGKVHGVEALARWKHPKHGLVPPDEFIPLAEEHGLIHQLTLAVMRQALLQTAQWNAEGIDLTVAINLSPLLFDRADLLQEISNLQQSFGLPADHVVLEVTESSLMRELSVALGVLTRLRLRGFGLSLDDYGTGFSSMQQLARIPFTELKIDRSFVKGAHERENLQVILRSALEMAAKLGLHTVAEGVESLEDWKLLQQYGCTFVQGWLLAKAMPPEDFVPWLKKHETRKKELSVAA